MGRRFSLMRPRIPRGRKRAVNGESTGARHALCPEN
jgi:hypothetical protein